MLEADLSRPVAAWLKGRGFKTYPEVAFRAGRVDMVALHPDPERELEAVELKLHLTRKVIQQAHQSTSFAGRVWAAVGGRPRPAGLALASRLGVGVLRVDRQTVIVEAEAAVQRPAPLWVAKMRGRLTRTAEGDVGGLANVEGDGPARRCLAAVNAYFAQHPGAQWKDAWRDVPNHYSSPRSMRQSLARLEVWLRHEAITKASARNVVGVPE